MLITLTSLTTILGILLVISNYNNNYRYRDDLKGFSIIGLVLILIFGWGFAAGIITSSYKMEDTKAVEILRGKHIVVVEAVNDSDEEPTIFKGNNIEMINDSTTFYWKIGYNAYGGETERELKFLPNLK